MSCFKAFGPPIENQTSGSTVLDEYLICFEDGRLTEKWLQRVTLPCGCGEVDCCNTCTPNAHVPCVVPKENLNIVDNLIGGTGTLIFNSSSNTWTGCINGVNLLTFTCSSFSSQDSIFPGSSCTNLINPFTCSQWRISSFTCNPFSITYIYSGIIGDCFDSATGNPESYTISDSGNISNPNIPHCCIKICVPSCCGGPFTVTVVGNGISLSGVTPSTQTDNCILFDILNPGTYTVTVTKGSFEYTNSYNLTCCESLPIVVDCLKACITGWCGQIYNCGAEISIISQNSNVLGTGTADSTGCVSIPFINSLSDPISSVQVISNFGTQFFSVPGGINFNCNLTYTFSLSGDNPPGGMITDNNGSHPVCWNQTGGWACYNVAVDNICPGTGSMLAITYEIFCDNANPGSWRVRRMWTNTSIEMELCYAGIDVSSCSTTANPLCCNCSAICLGVNLPYFVVAYSGDGKSNPCDPTAMFSAGLSSDPSCIALVGPIPPDPVGGGIVFSA